MGVGRLRLAHQRGQPRGGRGAPGPCSGPWPRCWWWTLCVPEAFEDLGAHLRHRLRASSAADSWPCSSSPAAATPTLRRSVWIAPLPPSTALGVAPARGGVPSWTAPTRDAPVRSGPWRSTSSDPSCSASEGWKLVPPTTSPSVTGSSSSSPWASRSSPSGSDAEAGVDRGVDPHRRPRHGPLRHHVVGLLRRGLPSSPSDGSTRGP